jgi:uncharacterized RDD family membrane protein YckC
MPTQQQEGREPAGGPLFCPNCGARVAEGAEICGTCGQRIGGWSAAWSGAARAPVAYAGFWLRLIAYAIDSLLLGFVLGNLLLRPLIGRPGGIPTNDPWFLFTNSSPQVTALVLLFLMGNWVYFSVSESSRWKATIGKKVLGLEVVDLAGNRVSFARASLRFFAKILSSMTFLIGFFMAGFTEKKQALHDLIAGCLVIKKV